MELTGFYTAQGQALSAALHAGGTLTVTRITAGSGQTAPADAALAGESQTLSVGTLTRSGVTVTIPATLTASLAAQAYSLREVGVYAHGGDGGEILYRVYRLSEALEVSPASRMVLRFSLEETVSSELAVSVTVSPEGLVTQEEFAPVRSAVETKDLETVAVTLAASEVQAYLDALPFLLPKSYVITLSGTLNDKLRVENFYGPGSITLTAAAAGGATLGGVAVSLCSLPVVTLSNLAFLPRYGKELIGVYVWEGRYVRVSSCSFNGSSVAQTIGVKCNAGTMSVESCSFTNLLGDGCVISQRSSFVSVMSCTGSGNGSYGLNAQTGGLIQFCDTPQLLGASSNFKYGGMIANQSGQLT